MKMEAVCSPETAVSAYVSTRRCSTEHHRHISSFVQPVACTLIYFAGPMKQTCVERTVHTDRYTSAVCGCPNKQQWSACRDFKELPLHVNAHASSSIKLLLRKSGITIRAAGCDVILSRSGRESCSFVFPSSHLIHLYVFSTYSSVH